MYRVVQEVSWVAMQSGVGIDIDGSSDDKERCAKNAALTRDCAKQMLEGCARCSQQQHK